MRPELSILVPLFNEEEVFPELWSRLVTTRKAVNGQTEIILINDGSSDATGALISEKARTDTGVIAVHLSRNFGHQQAIVSGLAVAEGNYVGIIDGDLQDPPELLPEMHALIQQGFDVVYAVRKNRKEHAIKRMAYHTFYRILSILTPVPIPLDSGDFCIMSSRVAKLINEMPERHKFLRGLRSYCGFSQTHFEYERQERQAGRSKYSLRALVRLASEGIFTFSERPLRVATFFGIISACMGLAYSFYLIVWRLSSDESLPGFATLAVAVLYLGGIQLICLGILGEYVGRIHNEVKQRPSYIVDRIERNQSN